MISKSIFTALAAAGALAAGAATAETVRMGTEANYPPFTFLNDSGEVDGFEREVGDEICARAEFDCTWVTTDLDSLIPNLISGNYDTIIAGMTITAERAKVIDFTQEYFPPDLSAYVVRAGEDETATKGAVAAAFDTVQAGHIAESEATLVEFPNWDDAIAALRNGEADAVLADKGFLQDIVNESGGELAFIGEDLMIGGGMGIGVRKSDPELKDRIDAAIASMKADGTLNELISKWFEGREPVY